MKFSVLIAHYNNSQYFKDCFESLQKQTYPNWEAIILDDFSNLEELENVENLIKNDNRFQLYKNKKNEGVGFTKAKLIDLSSGEICGFVDPDDAILPTAIERILFTYASDKIIAAYSQFYVCNSKLVKQHLFQASTQIDNDFNLFFNIFFNVNHFFTFRKSTYEKTIGIDKTLTSSVDQDLYLKLFEKGDFKFLNEPLYLYRTHNKEVSQNKNKKETLYKNWNKVLYNACKRRKITHINDIEVTLNNNLAELIFNKKNTYKKRTYRKLQRLLNIIKQKITA